MGIKEVYQNLEDKWYNALDKIDAKIPIYRVVDRIDKVVPSFVLFIAVFACIAAFLIAQPLLLGMQTEVTIIVEGSAGNLLPGVEVQYSVAGVAGRATTNQNGEISIFAPKNSALSVTVAETTVDGIEFEKAEKSFFVEETGLTAKIVLREKSQPFTERTIFFQDASGERITGKALKVRLSCQNPLATPSPIEVTDTDMDGIIKVNEPRDCGTFQATIIQPAEYRQRSYIVSRSTQTIMLEPNEVPEGSLRARVKDSAGNILVSTNFEVTLLDKDGYKVGQKYSQSYGEVIFSTLLAGNYTVSVEDTSGQYGIATQPGITVSADETATVDVIVSKTVKATLTVNVLDKATGEAIANATVRLINSEMETVAEKSTGEEAGQLEFRLTETGDYTLYAMHELYLYEVVEVSGSESREITIEMEEITEANSGRIEVNVVDEDNLPVKNARVKLRFLETGMLVPIEPKMTNSKGKASFTGVKPGSYYAYAEKFPAFGDNRGEGREIDIREITSFTVQLFIGNSLVTVNALDEDNLPVEEAEAEFYSLNGESLGKIPLSRGIGQFQLKADKQVYLVVTHPSYMAVQTMPKQLWPDQEIGFEAVMEPRLILGNPKIEFEGMFDTTGEQVHELKSGSRYSARFKLSIPEEGSYSRAGIHFRVGNEKTLANDPLLIKDAIAGNINAPLKGTTYNPPLGYEEDSQNLTEGDAKWMNIEFSGLEPMNYYFAFEVRVKSQVTPYTPLTMHYRAWATDSAGDYIRSPNDAELGTAESVASKQALYAKTLDIEFLEGQEAECQEDFCYSGESILDEDKGLYIYEPYQMRNGSRHRLTFNILNNSPRQYENSELYITVEGLTIDAYKVQNASAQEISSEGIATKSIEGIDLGAFTKGKSVSGEIRMTPNALGNATTEVKVIADARVVFLKKINASVVSDRTMLISLDPDFIPSYVSTNVQVKLNEEEMGYEVEDALVRVNIRNPDKTTMFYTGKTNGFGIAAFDLPALDPNTAITVEAEKPGYYAEPLTRTVDGNVLRFDPSSLKASLDTRGTTERTLLAEIRNRIGLDVTIEEIELSGGFKGLLDVTTMQNYSQQYVGTRIPAEESVTLQMFKVVLSRNAKDLLLKNEKLSGEYRVTASDRQTGMTWDFIIPLEVTISLGGLPDNSPCLSITRKEWVGATQGNRASIEFEIQNNCLSGNRFVELDNLQAKVNWISDAIGTVELSVTEADTGASNSAVLRSLAMTKLFDRVNADSTYYAILTFTPKSGHLGERAEFEVIIDGEIMTDAGPAFVGSSPSSIKSKIDVINLEQCIQYPDAETGVEMGASLDSTSFTIDASDCGETPVDIYLCYRDSGCRGGAKEGDIGVIPEEFTLRPNNPSKEIRVERRTIPGMYGVTVYAKVPGSSYREVHTVDVLIQPENDEAFYLDKYKFTVLGYDSKDSTTLTNRQLQEMVDVKASACAWDEAEEKGNFDPTGAFIGAGIGFTIGVLAPAGTFATIQSLSLFGLSFCPPCVVIMGVLAVLGGFAGGFFGEDPCDEMLTYPLPDWIINLEDDAQGTSMDNQFINATWVTDNPKYRENGETQEVGLVFENNGIEDIKPTYSTLTITAKKHHHADPTDYRNSSDFGTYDVRDRDTSTYTQRFHLKFDTKIVEQEIPPINYDTYSCTQGTLVGRTGPGSLPRTSLTWNWSETAGITEDACDYDNPDYIYCDATQFSIELSKKLHTLDEFLEVNRENLACPTSPLESFLTEYEENFNSRTVENGTIGLSQVTQSVAGNSLQLDFEVTNDTVSTQTATVTVYLDPPTGVSRPETENFCAREFDVAGQQSKKGSCTFSSLEPSSNFYGISVKIESDTTTFVDSNSFGGGFKITEAGEGECWMDKTTGLVDGKPGLSYFAQGSGNVSWTTGVPGIEALVDLLHFRSYLIKDGYSNDFKEDFAEYSINNDFFNAPDWFSDDPDGRLADYFEDPYYLDFTMRHYDSDQLSNAGLYDIVLDVEFVGDDWKMFDSYGEPNAKVKVEMYFLDEPYPNSVFYYLPFNGNVGVDSSDGRQGYGMDYDNVTEEIQIVGGTGLVKTQSIAGSSSDVQLKTEVVRDFKKINATASNRGFIMSLEEGSEVNRKSMQFYPNYATPVLMKMSSVKTEEPFSAFFGLRQDFEPVEVGSNLTFWDGAGQCLDYSGVPVVEAFDFQPDRAATAEDNLPDWQFAYAVDWTKADYPGKVYLKSVFYTPVQSQYSLAAMQPKELRFITPNVSERQAVELKGISGMSYNSSLGSDSIDALSEVFDLVREGTVCVVNSGTRTAFWWNPKVLYETAGSYSSIKAIEQGLVAGQSCIGYSS